MTGISIDKIYNWMNWEGYTCYTGMGDRQSIGTTKAAPRICSRAEYTVNNCIGKIINSGKYE